MDPSIDKDSISGSELAAGAIALAAVALIAFVGLRGSQQQDLPAPAKAPTAASTPGAPREPPGTPDRGAAAGSATRRPGRGDRSGRGKSHHDAESPASFRRIRNRPGRGDRPGR